LSQCKTLGGAQGLKKISWSALKAVMTIHTNGKITSTAQAIRKTSAKAVKAKSPATPRPPARLADTVRSRVARASDAA
jgi:hypothetical protein